MFLRTTLWYGMLACPCRPGLAALEEALKKQARDVRKEVQTLRNLSRTDASKSAIKPSASRCSL